jgi:Fe-S cluster biogenesis protein NfuA/nitrite reductase/ring-hydroxylating ferredoxin subunit
VSRDVESTLPEQNGDDLAALLGNLERLETIFAAWDDSARKLVEAYRGGIDALHKSALRRLIRGLREEPQARAALRAAAEDEIVHAVLRHHGLIKPSLNERLELALEGIRPMLASHGGDVDLVTVDPPRIEVRFTGACDGCAASTLTFHAGVKKAVQEACPEISEIVQVRGSTSSGAARFTSPFAIKAAGPWRAAGALMDIPDEGMRGLDLDGVAVLLFRRGTAVTCFQDACAHLGSSLRDGALAAGIVTCPHHGFRYDLASGECLTATEVQLQPHAVRVVAGRVEVRIAA